MDRVTQRRCSVKYLFAEEIQLAGKLIIAADLSCKFRTFSRFRAELAGLSKRLRETRKPLRYRRHVKSLFCDDGHSLFVRPYDPLSSASLSLWQQALSGCSFLRHSLFYVLWKCPSIYFTCISSSLICYVHVSYSCNFDPLTLLWMPVLSSHSGEGVQAFVPPR